MQQLLEKYNVPVPRYTSYPTVPFWKDGFAANEWADVFYSDFQKSNRAGISLYIHLPFCESLCTYCGCNKKITTDHSVEEVYTRAIMAEWDTYLSLMGTAPVIRELHLGGGTPTFFSPESLQQLVMQLLEKAIVPDGHEFSFEGHPNNTTRAHLQALYDIGFRRVSYGVQDNDAEVQRIINRIQPLAHVQRATDEAREIGYESVNYDLIYGLPRQSIESIERTINEVASLRPDRIAFYSYAHVPWTSRAQRLFDEQDLPSSADKMAMYVKGRELLMAHGYTDIGMDHFALPGDALYHAAMDGTLHRNFMGYTVQQTDFLLGLGVSAISGIPGAYAQNTKKLHDYYHAVGEGALPVVKGIMVTEADARFRRYILDISCKGHTEVAAKDLPLILALSGQLLHQLTADDLVVHSGCSFTVTSQGRNFIRNICSVFDMRLAEGRGVGESSKPVFSKSI